MTEFDLDNTEEITRWGPGFGRQAEALEPDRVSQQMVDELRALMQLMESSGNPRF